MSGQKVPSEEIAIHFGSAIRLHIRKGAQHQQPTYTWFNSVVFIIHGRFPGRTSFQCETTEKLRLDGFCLVGRSGEVLHIAKSGVDNLNCGRYAYPCKSLEYTLNISQSGDEAHLMIEQSENNTFEYCSKGPITKNLIIEGDAKGLVSLFCHQTIFEGYSTPLVFHFENSSLKFSNLKFISSHILASNVELHVTNCQFDNSVLFLMEKYRYTYYMDQTVLYLTSLEGELMNGYRYWTMDETSRHWSGILPLTCINTILFLKNATWLPQRSTVPSAIDAPSKLGIQAICQDITVSMASSNMADNPIYLFSVTNLNINISDTLFKGPQKGTATQGGLKVNSFSFPKLIVENCTFSHLKYNDIAFAQMSALRQLPAALYIEIHHFPFGYLRSNLNIKLVKPYGYHVYILNSTLTNNFRGLAINSWFGEPTHLEIFIKNTIFAQNEAINDGGAVYITNGKNTSVLVENCEFVSNKAGVIPFNVNLTNTGVYIGRDMLIALGFEILSDNYFRLDMEYSILFGGEATTESININVRGSGGAIFIKEAHAFKITGSHFANNTASNYGGAIYVGTQAELILENVSLLSGHVPTSLVSGILIQSYASKFYFINSYIKVLISSRSNVSAIYHSGEGVSYSTSIKNITVSCPQNTKLELHNSTIDIRAISYRLKSDFLLYNDLMYTCQPCLTGSYALEAGYFQHQPMIVYKRTRRSSGNSTIDSTTVSVKVPAPPPAPPPPPILPYQIETVIHHYNYSNVICHPCPYGGVCDRGIKSKTNYWGSETKGLVTFYKCPPGYCCSETVCGKFNKCGKHRYGVLCSKCESGYSEAIFSTICLPDDQCTHYWFIPVTITLCLVYALFLLFQNSFKEYLLGAPLGRQTLEEMCGGGRSTGESNKDRTSPESASASDHQDQDVVRTQTDEGGTFLILLFYYFQDAAIVHFTPVYAKAEDPIVTQLKKFVGGLFRFQINVFVFVDNICPFPGLDATSKVWIKLIFVPSLLLILFTIYFSTRFLSHTHNVSVKGKDRCVDMNAKTSAAITLAILFSYQKLASSAFSLVYCVPAGENNVLFIDGSITCTQTWQNVIYLYIYLCIVPFGVYISLAPGWLQTNTIGVGWFFLGCFFPGPVLFVTILRHVFTRTSREWNINVDDVDNKNSQTSTVYKLLQGPYREYHVPIPRASRLSLCWSGVLILRRLLLIIAFTYIHDILLRLLVMTTISFLALLHHLMVKPCKEQRANTAGTVSCAALLSVCIINLVRATFEVGEVIPVGSSRDIMNTLQLVEDCLLFWIPMSGACVMILLLLMRISVLLVTKINTCKACASKP